MSRVVSFTLDTEGPIGLICTTVSRRDEHFGVIKVQRLDLFWQLGEVQRRMRAKYGVDKYAKFTNEHFFVSGSIEDNGKPRVLLPKTMSKYATGMLEQHIGITLVGGEAGEGAVKFMPENDKKVRSH